MYCAGSTVHTIPASRITCQVVQQALYSTYLSIRFQLAIFGDPDPRWELDSWSVDTTIMLSWPIDPTLWSVEDGCGDTVPVLFVKLSAEVDAVRDCFPDA